MVFSFAQRLFGRAVPTAQVFAAPFAAMCAITLSTGCSVDDHGLVKVTQVETEASITRHAIASGLHVDTQSPLAGLSLGQFETVQVYVKSCGRLKPRLHYQNMTGLQLTASRYEVGISFGKREALLAAQGGPNSVSGIRFDPFHPESIVVAVSPTPRSQCQTQQTKGT